MTTRNPDVGTADIFLEYSGVKMPFRCDRTQSGNLAWRQSWAPMLPEEQRVSGPVSAQQYPAVIDIPLSFDDWSEGCGYTEVDDRDGAPRKYNYTQGIDASHPQRLYLSPLPQTPATDVTVAPTFQSDTTLGVFLTAGRYLYEWTVSSVDWTVRHDLGVGEAFTGPVVEFNGVLFAPAGDAKAYVTSTNGTSWTASSLADVYAHQFTVRGRSTTTPIIWKTNSDGGAKNNNDGTNSGGAWSAAVPLGHTSETINSFLNIDDKIRAFKVEGIFSYDGTEPEDTWVGGRTMRNTGNGRQAYVWVDGCAYAPYGNRLLRYDPLANAGFGSLSWVLPPSEWYGNIELNGSITAICGDANVLYVAMKNSAGNTYILKGVPGGAWHTFIYLGANDCNTIAHYSEGTFHATNPTLVFGYGAATRYVILTRFGLRPEDDTNYLFTASGLMYGPWVNVGSKSFKKFLNAGRVVSENTSAGKPITLGYQIDKTVSPVTLHTANSAGVTNTTVSTEVSFQRIRDYLTLATGDNTASPVGLGFMLNTVLAPPRKRVWTGNLICGDHQLQAGGGYLDVGKRDQETFLFRSSQQRCTLYDRDGRTFTVRVLDIGEEDGARPEMDSDAHSYSVTIVELDETTQETNVGLFDADAFDTNKVFGV